MNEENLRLAAKRIVELCPKELPHSESNGYLLDNINELYTDNNKLIWDFLWDCANQNYQTAFEFVATYQNKWITAYDVRSANSLIFQVAYNESKRILGMLIS